MSHKKLDFPGSEEGVKANEALSSMEASDAFNTPSSYTANTTKYPDNLISFKDKHMDYLQNHPNLNPDQYIANLRLITRR